MGRRSHSCQATARTEDNILTNVSDIDLHTHPNDVVEIQRKCFTIEVKNEVNI